MGASFLSWVLLPVTHGYCSPCALRRYVPASTKRTVEAVCVAVASVLCRFRGIVRTVGNRGVCGLLLLVRLLVVCPLGCSLRLLRQSPARRMQARPPPHVLFPACDYVVIVLHCQTSQICRFLAPWRRFPLSGGQPTARHKKSPTEAKNNAPWGCLFRRVSIPLAPALGVFHVVGHL